jgi:hypothetical protein
MTPDQLVESFLETTKKTDKTFTAFDIIRIACLNLEKDELRAVILFFMIGVPLIIGLDFLDLILEGFKLPKKLITLVKMILKFIAKQSIFEILFLIGLKLDINNLEVLKKIIARLKELFGVESVT